MNRSMLQYLHTADDCLLHARISILESVFCFLPSFRNAIREIDRASGQIQKAKDLYLDLNKTKQ